MEWLPSSIATIVVSGTISIIASLVTAKKAAQHELAKMGFQYEHDDSKQLNEAYAKMRASVLIYVDRLSGTYKNEALSALSSLIAIAPPELHENLQLLQERLMKIHPQQSVISPKDVREIKDTVKALDDIWAARSLAAKKKRKHK